MTLTSKKLAAAVLAITVAMSLSACSNWSKRDRNTAIYAGYIRRRCCRWYYRSPGWQIILLSAFPLRRFSIAFQV